MKKRYYLRGLGIGIFITALIMGLTNGGRKPMTDEEVRARALELGMVEKKTLADVREEESNQPHVTEAPKETMSPETTEAPKETMPPEATEAPKETTPPETTKAPVVTEPPEPTQSPTATDIPKEEDVIILLEIVKGDSSDTISQKLEDLGLIANARSYNRYLCDNGYDRRLNIGTYEIQKGASEEEIAKIITRTR